MSSQPPGEPPTPERQAFTPARDALDDPYEGATPPGFDWPTHGGYLGCLLGLVVACMLCGLIGAPLAQLSNFRVLSTPVALVLTLAAAVVLIALFGRIGWVLGKRFYREYPQPAGRLAWGEARADEEASEGTPTGEPPVTAAPGVPIEEVPAASAPEEVDAEKSDASEAPAGRANATEL